MSINPQTLGNQIDEITQATSTPISDEPADMADSQDVQVAGLKSGLEFLLEKGASTMDAGKATKAAKAAEKATAKIETSVEKAIPAPTPKVPQTNVTTPGATKATAVTKQVSKLQTQLQTVEDTIEAAPVSGNTTENLINLDRIEGPDDFKQTVDALATSSGLQIEGQTWEETLAQAKAKGFGSDILVELQQLKEQYGDIPRDVLRMRLAGYQNIKEFYDLARQSYLNPDDTDLQAKLLYKLSLQNGINETYLTARTRSAQATAIGNMPITEGRAAGIMDDLQVKIPSISDAEMKEMLANPDVSENLKVLVEKFVQLTDEGAREGLINKVSKVGLVADLWDRTWKNGLLSATGTHIINLGSNTTFLASSVATRAVAGLVGSGKRALGMNAEVELGEAGAMIAGIVSSFREGLSLGWTAMKTGTTREMRQGTDLLSDAGQKLEGQYHIFNARDYGYENEAFIKGVNGWANFVTLLGGRPIMAMDEVFKTMGYRAELYAQAYRNGEKARRLAMDAGASADEAELQSLSRMSEILSDPPKDIEEAANDFAQMITFSRKLTGASAQIQKLSQDHLVGRIVMPFVKTPTWVASESMQHSAFAPLSSQWRQDFMAGGAKRELAVTKWGMGSALMIGVGSYVADGRITGGGPGDTNLRNIYLESGWRPYSFVFQKGEWDDEFIKYLKGVGIDPSISENGRLYVPFRGIDPIAGPMSMMADAVEYARYEDDEDKVGQVLLGAVWGLYSYVGQQPFLQGISSIAGAFSQTIPNPKAAFRNAIDSVISAGASYIVEGSPVGVFSSARAVIERNIDNTKRMVKESPNLPTGVKGFFEGLNKSIARTPFLSEKLPVQYDYLGQEMTDIDPASPWLAGATGVRFSNSKQRPADKAMIQLGMSIKKPDMSIVNGDVSVKLEPEEYSDMMNYLGKIQRQIGVDQNTGQRKFGNIADSIAYLYKDPAYQQLDLDMQQVQMRELYSSFVKEAQDELIMNSRHADAIQKRFEEAQNKRPRVGIYAK